jgi:hypothetical protein
MRNDHNINPLAEHYLSLNPAERDIFRRAIIARAHRERAELMRAGLHALARWLDRLIEMVLRAVFTPKIPAQPLRRD